ncbi:MAG TPA: lipoyl(octanoyl) transferase LipB [Steroidobacteraceae bacterium]|nr:lipoyl(octanoyl) transferase LipB [Steroidobacteraceae bacterium]
MHAVTSGAAANDQTGPVVRRLGLVEYEPTWRAMQRFTDSRDAATRDEIWFLEHPPVFTLGLNGRREHVLAPAGIPVVHVDRGGQVTYHGPGQLVVYPLVDLKRARLGIRDLVTCLEASVIELCGELGVEAAARRDAPGVYVGARKLASIGLRVRRGASFHGLALNVSNDVEPFTRINPCGYAGLEVARLADLSGHADVDSVAARLEPILVRRLYFFLNSSSSRARELSAVDSAPPPG